MFETSLVAAEARSLADKESAVWRGCLDYNIDHCVHCGRAYVYDRMSFIGDDDLTYDECVWAFEIRINCVFPEFWDECCKPCREVRRPYLFRLYDIYQLLQSANKLLKAANDKRREGNQNNRATSDATGERGKGRAER